MRMAAIACTLACLTTPAFADDTCTGAPSAASAFVALPGHPFGAVASLDGCWVFASVNSANPRSANGIAVLQRSRGQLTVKRVIPVEAEPAGITLTHDGKLLIVADGDFVVFMDTARMIGDTGDPIVGYIKDGDSPGSVYVNTTADDKLLFVSDEAAQSISVIDLQRARTSGFKDTAIIGKIPVGRAPIALTFSPDGRWLYTTSQVAPDSLGWPIECKPEGEDPAVAKPRFPAGAIFVVDVDKAKTDPAHSVTARVPAGCSPVRLAIAPNGARVFVTARNSNALLAFDAAKLRTDAAHARIGTVPVGASPVGIAVVDNGRRVVVSNSNRFARDQTARQTLSVIDPARVGEGAAAVVGSVPAGVFPREFGHSPDRLTVYVANYISSELQIVDPKRLP